MESSIIAILLGKHAYSLDPENETAWVRVSLLIGLIVGLVIGVVI